jgi:hypothetical protein
MPKLIVSQTFSGSRQVRIVVDGQQRMRTLLEFYKGSFPILRMHNDEYAGFRFSQLPEEVQQTFLRYELGVDVIFDAEYEQLIEIFSRINTYTVKLNAQELRNAKYLGYFKQASFAAGKRYASYWVANKVLTSSGISRMAEAELASNLLIVCLTGIQSNKVVDKYYAEYEDVENGVPSAVVLFDRVMGHIADIYPNEELAQTIWASEPLFYSLFAAIRNAVEPLPVHAQQNSYRQFGLADSGRLRVLLDSLSAEFESASSQIMNDQSNALLRFVNASQRRTADVGSRSERTRYICTYLSERL